MFGWIIAHISKQINAHGKTASRRRSRASAEAGDALRRLYRRCALVSERQGVFPTAGYVWSARQGIVHAAGCPMIDLITPIHWRGSDYARVAGDHCRRPCGWCRPFDFYTWERAVTGGPGDEPLRAIASPGDPS